MSYQFEICTNSVRSSIAAQKGGANRVELCAAIPEGGTTPSYGEIKLARELLNLKLHPIIRPRGGDFLYTEEEIQAMLYDIEMAKQLGADGVVFGCLNKNGEIDAVVMRKLMKAASGLSVTFHRAFDLCKDPLLALEQIIDLGCNRILTSGQETNAELGIPLLERLNHQSNGRITILAGCGVNETNIKKIATETGIKEFHFSARENLPSKMEYKKQTVSMGNEASNEYSISITTEERVRRTIKALLS